MALVHLWNLDLLNLLHELNFFNFSVLPFMDVFFIWKCQSMLVLFDINYIQLSPLTLVVLVYFVMHLMQYIAHRTPLKADDIEIWALKGQDTLGGFKSNSILENADDLDPVPMLVDPRKDQLQLLQQHENLGRLKATYISSMNHLVSFFTLFIWHFVVQLLIPFIYFWNIANPPRFLWWKYTSFFEWLHIFILI